MKIALFTQSLFALPLERAIPAAVEAGYSAIELACGPPHFDIALARRHRRAVADHVAAAGLTVSALSLFNCFTDRATLERQIAEAEIFIAMAPLFHADVVKLTPGPPGSGEASDGHWACLVEAVERLGASAEAVGVRLAFETHMRQLTDTLASTQRLLDGVEQGIGLTVDFSNLAFAGDDPAEAVSTLRERMFNTHVKNGRIDSDGAWWFGPLDEGLTDYRVVLRCLAEVGYDSYLTVECLGPDAAARPVETARRDREILERLLAETLGKAG